jgi:hypothetical protein
MKKNIRLHKISFFLLILILFASQKSSLTVLATSQSITLPVKPVGHFTALPVSNELYVARGGTLFIVGDDLYISKDGGKIWDVVSFPDVFSMYKIYTLAISPDFQNDGTAIVLFCMSNSNCALATTHDAGISWTTHKIYDIVATSSQIAFSPNYKFDHTIYAAPPLVKSVDGGLNWVSILPTGLYLWGDIVFSISPNYATDHEIVVISNNPTTKMLMSNDDSNWYPADTNLGIGSSFYSEILYVPDGLSNLGEPILLALVGGSSLRISEDGGISWKTINVRISEDGGNSWKTIGISGIKASKNPASGKIEIFGYGLNHNIFSLDSGETWNYHEGNGPLTGFTLSPDYVSDGIIFGSNTHGLWKSVDRGVHWQLIKANLGYVESWKPELVISPTYEIDQTLIVYSKTIPDSYEPVPTLWQLSSNGGRNWVDMPLPFTLTTGVVMRMAISPQYAYDHTIFVSKDNEIYRSTNSGVLFEKFGKPAANPIKDIKLSPKYPTDPTLFAHTTKEIIRSNNNAASWETIFQSPVLNANIVLSPNYPNDHTLFVNSGYIYISNNSGDNWSQIMPPEFGGLIEISPDFSNDRTLFWGIKESSGGRIFKSIDDGYHWSEIYSLGFFVQSIAVSPRYAVDQTLIICAEDSYPFISEDGGTTFSPLMTNQGFNDLGIAYENGMATIFASGIPFYRYEWPTLTTIKPILYANPFGSTEIIHGTVDLQNNFKAPVTWNAENTKSWLSLPSNSGTYPDKIAFTLDPSGLVGFNQTWLTLDIYFSSKQKTRVTIPISLLIYTDQIWLPQVINTN